MNDASPFLSSRMSPELVETFTTLICNGNEDDAQLIIEQLMVADAGFETIMLELFAPAARLLGQGWCEDRRDFLEVTLGMGRLQQLLRQFRLPAAAPGQLRGHGLLVPVPGEQHTFGLRMVEEHLLRADWKVSAILRASEGDISRLVAAEPYDFVGFSISAERLLPALRSAIGVVRSSSRNQSVRIVVGGVVFAGRDIAPSEIDADAIVNDAQEAVAQANQWSAMAAVE